MMVQLAQLPRWHPQTHPAAEALLHYSTYSKSCFLGKSPSLKLLLLAVFFISWSDWCPPQCHSSWDLLVFPNANFPHDPSLHFHTQPSDGPCLFPKVLSAPYCHLCSYPCKLSAPILRVLRYLRLLLIVQLTVMCLDENCNFNLNPDISVCPLQFQGKNVNVSPIGFDTIKQTQGIYSPLVLKKI